MDLTAEWTYRMKKTVNCRMGKYKLFKVKQETNSLEKKEI